MIILISLYGLLIGSFLNVCIYRLPREESIAFPPSHCPRCENQLKFYNLIPVFSFLIQRGRCSYCGETISPQYPLVESLNMLAYVAIYSRFGMGLDFIFYCLIASLLIVIAFIDLNEMLISDRMVALLVLLKLGHKLINYFAYDQPMNMKSSLMGVLVGGGVFLLIYIVSQGGMGDGDITLMAALGFILGWKYVILNIILSFLLGAIISVGLLAFKIKDRKDPIPFGPFIILGFFIVLFFGDIILNWYLNNFVYI